MGCHVTVQIEADAHGKEVLQSLPQRFAALEAILTRFNLNSELMRFNARAGEWVAVDDVLFANICAAKHAALLTDGLYNPLVLPALIASGYDRSFEEINISDINESTQVISDWREIDVNIKTKEVRIPAGSALDLGGIAKGWTATTIADELAEIGPCLVNIGGDMVGRGAPNGFPGWYVEIEDPFTHEAFTTICLYNRAISTSGIDYRRWQSVKGEQCHHIIDPRTAKPAVTDVLSATVIHPSAIIAEAYAKSVILQGAEHGLTWLNQQWHTAGLVFRQDGTVLATSTFIHERN